MLVWVVNIMCETLLPNMLGLLFNDNLKKCDSISIRYAVSNILWFTNFRCLLAVLHLIDIAGNIFVKIVLTLTQVILFLQNKGNKVKNIEGTRQNDFVTSG